MLSKACRKLTEEQHDGFGTTCRFEKSIAMELACHFDPSKDSLSPAAVREMARDYSSPRSSQSTVLAATSYKKGPKLPKVCTYCHKKGHLEEKCYKKEHDCRNQRSHLDTDHDSIFAVHNVNASNIDFQDGFYLDSGATHHVSNKCDYFVDFTPCEEELYGLKGLPVQFVGEVLYLFLAQSLSSRMLSTCLMLLGT